MSNKVRDSDKKISDPNIFNILSNFGEETLDTNVKRKYFEFFLIYEFSLELLEFYDEVSLFRELESNEELIQSAKYIYETFIEDGSSKQVPTPHEISLSIKESLNQPTKTLFDLSISNTIQNMRNDQFARFLQSPSYKEMLEDISKNYNVTCKLCGVKQHEESHVCGSCNKRASMDYSVIPKDFETFRNTNRKYQPNYQNSIKVKGKEKLSYFNNMINNPEKSKYFREFLARENSELYLDIYQKIMVYKAETQITTRVGMAFFIVKKYLEENAESKIEVSPQIVKTILEVYKNGSNNIFDELAVEVFKILRLDAYMRFIHTEIFANMHNETLNSKSTLTRSTSIYQFNTKLLLNPGRSKYFKQFLESEHSDDNFNFYHLVEDFKLIDNETTLKEKAVEIYRNYCDSSQVTSHSVNLSSHVIEEIKKKIEKSEINRDVFNKAQSQILKLMNDPFIRFRFSQNFYNM
eukprot:TRINITY_DN14163_c0_g1_i1.p1 TRINITY_DN14163_c0_g1~~TRINITY_DN14163_c0_g1_i1.p1  ORF type:complete len:465 (-),score=120.37 TRINITY_DN14163_c0_g1_i1:54-1448(-)